MVSLDKVPEPLPISAPFADPVKDVGAIETVDVLCGLREFELLFDFPKCTWIRGRGQRNTGYIGIKFMQAIQVSIIRAKIVTPLRNTMCFIDGEQRDLALRQ